MEKYQQYRQHNSSDLRNKTAQQTFRCIIYVILVAGSRFIQEGGVLWSMCRSRLSQSS